MKKILLGITTFFFISIIQQTSASNSTYYADLIADAKIINKQYTASAYRLQDTLTRAELAKIAVKLGKLNPNCSGKLFIDVKKDLGDLCGYVESLARAGIVENGYFYRPNDTITRAEAIKILLGSAGERESITDAGYTDTIGLGDLGQFINRAKEIGLLPNHNKIYPNKPILRHEVFVLASIITDLDSSIPAFLADQGTNQTTLKNQNYDKYLLGRTWYDSTFLGYANLHPEEAKFIAKCDSLWEAEKEHKTLPDNLGHLINTENPCLESISYGIYDEANDKGLYKDGDVYYVFSCSFDFDDSGRPTVNTTGYKITMTDMEKRSCSEIWLRQEGM